MAKASPTLAPIVRHPAAPATPARRSPRPAAGHRVGRVLGVLQQHARTRRPRAGRTGRPGGSRRAAGAATTRSSSSPAACPSPSLTTLKSSRSRNSSARCRFGSVIAYSRAEVNAARLARPVSASWRACAARSRWAALVRRASATWLSHGLHRGHRFRGHPAGSAEQDPAVRLLGHRQREPARSAPRPRRSAAAGRPAARRRAAVRPSAGSTARGSACGTCRNVAGVLRDQLGVAGAEHEQRPHLRGRGADRGRALARPLVDRRPVGHPDQLVAQPDQRRVALPGLAPGEQPVGVIRATAMVSRSIGSAASIGRRGDRGPARAAGPTGHRGHHRAASAARRTTPPAGCCRTARGTRARAGRTRAPPSGDGQATASSAVAATSATSSAIGLLRVRYRQVQQATRAAGREPGPAGPRPGSPQRTARAGAGPAPPATARQRFQRVCSTSPVGRQPAHTAPRAARAARILDLHGPPFRSRPVRAGAGPLADAAPTGAACSSVRPSTPAGGDVDDTTGASFRMLTGAGRPALRAGALGGGPAGAGRPGRTATASGAVNQRSRSNRLDPRDRLPGPGRGDLGDVPLEPGQHLGPDADVGGRRPRPRRTAGAS